MSRILVSGGYMRQDETVKEGAHPLTAPHNARSVIKVVGVGGGGDNSVNQMLEVCSMGVEVIAVNTDAQALLMRVADVKLDGGRELTRGPCGHTGPQLVARRDPRPQQVRADRPHPSGGRERGRHRETACDVRAAARKHAGHAGVDSPLRCPIGHPNLGGCARSRAVREWTTVRRWSRARG